MYFLYFSFQDASVEVANQIEMGSQEPSEDHCKPAAAGVSKLHESHTKVQTVEKVILEMLRDNRLCS